jgi:hypothetical protein
MESGAQNMSLEFPMLNYHQIEGAAESYKNGNVPNSEI